MAEHRSTANGEVMTVLGPIDPTCLGTTLMHEHLFVDLTCNWQPPSYTRLRSLAEGPVTGRNVGLLRRDPLASRDNCILDDFDTAVEEARLFYGFGGSTMVDVTIPDIGRDPIGMQMVARETGLHIVAGCGHYTKAAHPPTLAKESVEVIAERLVAELTTGIDDTGVRPGIIGELGTSDPLHPDEAKVLQAGAQAHKQTGVAISLHVLTRNGHQCLDILEGEGVSLSRVIVGHQDLLLGGNIEGNADVFEHLTSLASRGCFIQFDCCGKEHYFPGLPGHPRGLWCPSDFQRVQGLVHLLAQGFDEQLLLSHDICHKIELLRYGGFGYAHILRTFTRHLREAGVSSEAIDKLLVLNPRRALTPAFDSPAGRVVAADEAVR